MANPYDFRESMKVAFGYSDKTMEQLEQERAERDRASNRPGRGRPSRTLRPVPTTTTQPLQGELDKLAELMSKAKPRLKPTQE